MTCMHEFASYKWVCVRTGTSQNLLTMVDCEWKPMVFMLGPGDFQTRMARRKMDRHVSFIGSTLC